MQLLSRNPIKILPLSLCGRGMIGRMIIGIIGSIFFVMHAGATPLIPCQIRLDFTRDAGGIQIARYRLFLQLTNSQPQPIEAVSVHWHDKDNRLIGNSDADCRFEGEALRLSQTGQCTSTIQTISQKLIDSFGQSIWTEIVNAELAQFNQVTSCQIAGYRYFKAPLSRGLK